MKINEWLKENFFVSILIPILVGSLSFTITASYKNLLKIEYLEKVISEQKKSTCDLIESNKQEFKNIKQNLYILMTEQGVSPDKIKNLITESPKTESSNNLSLNANTVAKHENDPIPEPATMLLIGTGLTGLIFSNIGRRKQKKSSS